MKRNESKKTLPIKRDLPYLYLRYFLYCILLFFSTGRLLAQIKPIINRGTTRALIIGISDYQNDKIPALQFAHRDAETFATFLQQETAWKVAPENTVLLINDQATYGKFLGELKALVEESRAGDRFIIYFSGHGDVETSTEKKSGYLLFYDSSPTTYSSSSACKVTTLNKVISDLVLKQETEVLLITDACRSGELAGSSNGGPGQTTAALSELFENTTKFLSCGPNEFSVEGERWGGGRGLFSYHLINGFKGLADNNPEDRYIDFFELQRYVEDSVRWDSRQQQTPIGQGRRDRKLAKVLPQVKERLQKQLAPPTYTATSSKQVMAVDTGILEKFTLFERALSEKRLMYPEEGSAAQIYRSVGDDAASQAFKKIMKISLTTALQDEAQQALNEYILSPGKELAKRWANAEIYNYYPEYLGMAAELIGTDNYFHDEIKSKEHYFRGVNWRLKADAIKDKDSLINLAMAEQLTALKLKPQDAPHIYNEMGLLFRRLGQKQEELSSFQEAHTLSPKWGLALSNLAYTHRRLKNYEEAEKLYKEAIQLDESLALPHNNLGTLYLKTGKYKLAEKSLEQAMTLDPTFAKAYYNLAYVYVEDSTKLVDAEKVLLKYLGIRSNNINAYNLLLYTYIQLGNLEKAEQVANKALAIDQNYTLTWYNLIYLYQKQGRLEEAKKWSKKAIEHSPDDVDFLFQWIGILTLKNEISEALDWLEKMLKTHQIEFSDIDETPELDALRTSERFKLLMQTYFPGKG